MKNRARKKRLRIVGWGCHYKQGVWVRFYRDLEEVRELAMRLRGKRMFQTEWPVRRPVRWEFVPGVFTEQPEDLGLQQSIPRWEGIGGESWGACAVELVPVRPMRWGVFGGFE